MNLDQAAQGFVQRALDSLQEQRFHSLSGQSVPVLNYIFIVIYYFFFFTLELETPYFSLGHISRSSTTHLLLGLLTPPLLQAEQAQLSVSSLPSCWLSTGFTQVYQHSCTRRAKTRHSIPHVV